MTTISVSKLTRVDGKQFRAGTHIVDDETAKALIETGNAAVKGEAAQGSGVSQAVAPDHYGPTGVTHKEKKAVKPKKEAE